jgi:LPXTG-motif cell wall-anchored protein
VNATVTIPQDATAGEHSIVVRGLESGRSASVDIIVTRSPGASAGALPATGGELPVALISVGALLALGGGVLVTRTLLRNRKAA